MLSQENISHFGVIPYKQSTPPVCSTQAVLCRQEPTAAPSSVLPVLPRPPDTACKHSITSSSGHSSSPSSLGQIFTCLSHRATEKQFYISSISGDLCCSGSICEAHASLAAPPAVCRGRTHTEDAKLCCSFCSDTSHCFTTKQVSINSRQEFVPFLLAGLLKKSSNPGERPSHPAQLPSCRRPGQIHLRTQTAT